MSKPLPVFSQMPHHIKRGVLEATDTRTKLALRRCDTILKKLADKSSIHLHTVYFQLHIDERYAVVYAPSLSDAFIMYQLEYHDSPYGYIKKNKWTKQQNHVSSSKNYIEAAVERFLQVFRTNLKVVVKKFTVELIKHRSSDEIVNQAHTQVLDTIEACLISLGAQIHVSEFTLQAAPHQKHIMRILPYLTPGVLEKIQLNSNCFTANEVRGRITNIDLGEVALTEQWRRATELDLASFYLEVPVGNTDHFSVSSGHSNILGIREIEDTINNILKPDGWMYRKYLSRRINLPALLQYLSQYEIISNYSNEKVWKVRRGDDECIVEISQSWQWRKVTFYNPKMYLQ